MIYFILIFVVILSQVLIAQNIAISRKLKRLQQQPKRKLSDIHFESPLPPPPSLDDMLHVCWNEDDQELEFFYPEGKQTKEDARYLMYSMFNIFKCKELECRGYDISTLKFKIAPKKGNKKFVSERNKRN